MVFSLRLWPTMKSMRQNIQANRWRFRLLCGCGGTTRGRSPDGAHPGLHSKPLDAAIGRVLVSHRRGGRNGRRFWSKTQNTNKKLFLASSWPTVDWSQKLCELSTPQIGPSTQLIDVTSFIEHFKLSNVVSRQNLKKLSSNYKASNKGRRISATIGVFLLTA